MAEITHNGTTQIVSPAALRRVLRADGECCYCAPFDGIEWNAGECPQHRRPTRQAGEVER